MALDYLRCRSPRISKKKALFQEQNIEIPAYSDSSGQIKDDNIFWGGFFGTFWDLLGFPDSSVGKESVCNVGDPGLIPGLGRSTREGIGYLLQYSWTSSVSQLVKNTPAMWETWV